MSRFMVLWSLYLHIRFGMVECFFFVFGHTIYLRPQMIMNFKFVLGSYWYALKFNDLLNVTVQIWYYVVYASSDQYFSEIFFHSETTKFKLKIFVLCSVFMWKIIVRVLVFDRQVAISEWISLAQKVKKNFCSPLPHSMIRSCWKIVNNVFTYLTPEWPYTFYFNAQ